MNAIDVRGVAKVFNPGRSNQVEALSGIDLSVESGEFITLIGPSGCGKSTLLRLIASLLSPSAGSVQGQRQAGGAGPARPGLRHGLPDGRSVRLAHCGQEHRVAARADGLVERRPAPKVRRDAGSRQARRVRQAPSLRAVGRDAAAGGHRPSPGLQPIAVTDGRAVRGARRDDPRAHAGRAAADLGGDRGPPWCSSPTPSPKRCTCPLVSW